ncbi:unnamed protein product [Parascedosporium putredinis]|uniref:Uncharacterized protein n=1 Tax=Parascedosporium putredinis TaxID=1442378 RepID=A0A9P1H0N9_9PEZI|nr:unnamed protein product [Parascedosporium putredinis]CAI7991967.1 unnamed protein product [Parascedosporium putredinis]
MPFPLFSALDYEATIERILENAGGVEDEQNGPDVLGQKNEHEGGSLFHLAGRLAANVAQCSKSEPTDNCINTVWHEEPLKGRLQDPVPYDQVLWRKTDNLSLNRSPPKRLLWAALRTNMLRRAVAIV